MNLNILNVPKKISPSPIAEAIVEIRFDSTLSSETMLAIIYNDLKEKYPTISSLPIMEFPSSIRDFDPNFKFAPHYRLANDHFIVQFGPRSLSVVAQNGYQGWGMFYDQIKWVFDKIKKLDFLKKPLRLGVRYINFFENCNIFEKIKIELSLANNSLKQHQNVLRSEFDYNNFHCIINLTNVAIQPERNIKGSSIDLDVIYDINFENLDNSDNIINEAHDLTKKLFFIILEDDFLKELKPEY